MHVAVAVAVGRGDTVLDDTMESNCCVSDSCIVDVGAAHCSRAYTFVSEPAPPPHLTLPAPSSSRHVPVAVSIAPPYAMPFSFSDSTGSKARPHNTAASTAIANAKLEPLTPHRIVTSSNRVQDRRVRYTLRFTVLAYTLTLRGQKI